MTKIQAEKKIMQYLKSHYIEFEVDLKDGICRYTMILHGYENSPNKVLESCIWFFEDVMEVRCYYTQNASDWCEEYSNNIPDLMRLFNFINASIWVGSTDGMNGALYKSNYLYTPRLYMTEDGFHDITLTTIIPYDFYEVATLETEDYIIASCPYLLDSLSPAIFLLLFGRIDFDTAVKHIKSNTLFQ